MAQFSLSSWLLLVWLREPLLNWYANIHRRTHKSSPLDQILGQWNKLTYSCATFIRSNSNYPPPCARNRKCSLPFRYSNQHFLCVLFTALNKTNYWTLSSASWIQFTFLHTPESILILLSYVHINILTGFVPYGFLTNICYIFITFFICAMYPSHSIKLTSRTIHRLHSKGLSLAVNSYTNDYDIP